MRKIPFILLYFLLGFVFSCTKPGNYIIETNIAQIALNASKNGLTVEQNGKLGLLVVDSMKKNTIGKAIPNVIVTNLSNKKLNLPDQLNTDCVIICSDIYCGFGLDCMSNLFPKAIKEFNDKNENIRVICLLKRTEDDVKNPKLFNKTLNELKPLYKTIYCIDEKVAGKLNLNMNPTRLYVNKNNTVTNITFGISFAGDYLYKELKQNAVANAN